MVLIQDAPPEARLAFVAEWLDPNSGIRWKYQLFHYPVCGEVEMHDIKNRRVFLKRSRCDVPSEDFYVGSTVTLYSRHLRITDYGDDSTRSALESRTERTCAVVKPDGVRSLGKILRAVAEAGLTVSRLRMAQLDRREAEAFCAAYAKEPLFAGLVGLMCGGRVVAMELVGKQAVEKWREVLGPDDPEEVGCPTPAREEQQQGTQLAAFLQICGLSFGFCISPNSCCCTKFPSPAYSAAAESPKGLWTPILSSASQRWCRSQ